MEQTQSITIEQLKQEELRRELDDYYSDPHHDPDYYDLAVREEMGLEPRSEYPAPKRQEGGEVSW